MLRIPATRVVSPRTNPPAPSARRKMPAIRAYCLSSCCPPAGWSILRRELLLVRSLICALTGGSSTATYSCHLCAALGAHSLHCGPAVFQRDFFAIFHVYHLAVFHTICLHHGNTSTRSNSGSEMCATMRTPPVIGVIIHCQAWRVNKDMLLGVNVQNSKGGILRIAYPVGLLASLLVL